MVNDSFVNDLKAFVEGFFNALDIEFEVGNYSFSLLDVFIAGVILSVIGYFIGKIVFFFNNRR